MTTQTLPQVAIIGAGPAGLTAACILQRHGWPITVFEADTSTEARDQGGTLDLHPDTGQLALDKAGLLTTFLAVARTEDQGTRVLEYRTGAVLAEELPAPGEGDRPEIDRKALRELLLAPLTASTVRWRQRLHGVEPLPDGRHCLCLADGKREPFDLVIGADGAWSKVRQALTATRPVYTGTTFTELWLDDVDVRHPSLARLVGRGTMFALHAGMGLVAQRNGGGHIRVYVVQQTQWDGMTRPSPEGLTQEGLAERFAGWSPDLVAFITKADAIAAVRPIMTLTPELRWPPRTGLTLIGDAAHVMPPVGLGVNLAMLDAAELAEALVGSVSGQNAIGWPAAVRRFEEQMLSRAEGMIEGAREGFAEMFGTDAPRAVLAHIQGH